MQISVAIYSTTNIYIKVILPWIIWMNKLIISYELLFMFMLVNYIS